MTTPTPTCDDLTGPASWLCSTLNDRLPERLQAPAPPPPPDAPWWALGTTWATLAGVVLLVIATVAVRRSPPLQALLRAAVVAARVQLRPANVAKWGGPAGRAVLAVTAGAWRFIRAGRTVKAQAWRAVAVTVAALLVVGSPLGVGGFALGAVSAATGVHVAVLVIGIVGLVVAVVVASRDEREERGWWTHTRLVRAMLDAGVLTRPRADEPPPSLSYRGQPQHDEHGTSCCVQLPAGRTFRDVLAKHEALAGALGVPAHRLTLSQQRDDPAGVVRLHVAAGSVRVRAEPAVARSERTDWREPVELGRDGQGRPVTFRTVGTHSALVGGTGSGKTATGRLVIAHALLDPAVQVFAVVPKDDSADWRAMAPLCVEYVGGVSEDALRRAEQVLQQVEALSESRADAGRDVAPVVVVIEEWFRLRSAAARHDAALAKRLDALLGEVLATSRSRGVTVLVFAQRGTVEYLPADQRANLLQRLVGRTGSRAEVTYVLDEAPTALPSRAGEFLLSTDERTPAMVQVDHLSGDAWSALCTRAASLRGARPGVEQRSPYARPLPPEVEVEPVADPLVQAVVALLADGDPRGLTATALHAGLPDWLRPASPAALGRALAGHPALARGHVGSTPIWRLTRRSVASLGAPSAHPRSSLGAEQAEGLTCDDAGPTFRQPAPVDEPSAPSAVTP